MVVTWSSVTWATPYLHQTETLTEHFLSKEEEVRTIRANPALPHY